MCIVNAPFTFMMKILLDLNHIIGSFAKKVLATVLQDFLIFMTLVTKSIQNNQNVKFSAYPPHKMWEYHFKLNGQSVVLQSSSSLKCYSQILCRGSAENLRFWLFCIDMVKN